MKANKSSRCFVRIRERRQLIYMESKEKRKVEKPRMPRTAKKVSSKDLINQMDDMGVEIKDNEEVTIVLTQIIWLILLAVQFKKKSRNIILCKKPAIWYYTRIYCLESILTDR